MAAADRKTGKDMVVLWVDGSGTINISGDMTTFGLDGEQESADVTAFGDSARYEKPTIKKYGATYEAHFTGTAGSAVYARLTLGAEGSVLYGPEGTATNKPKGGIPAFVKKRSIAYKFDEASVISVEFGPQGAQLFDELKDKW